MFINPNPYLFELLGDEFEYKDILFLLIVNLIKLAISFDVEDKGKLIFWVLIFIFSNSTIFSVGFISVLNGIRKFKRLFWF